MSDPAIAPEALLREALLREPWDGLRPSEDEALSRQRFGAAFGIWIFIASEVPFFGALFLFYAAMRAEHAEAVAAAARETNIVYGTLNTVLLLTSSLTAAAASRASEHASLSRLTFWCLVATAVPGLAFLAVKGMEYRQDIAEHLVPGPGLELPEASAQLSSASTGSPPASTGSISPSASASWRGRSGSAGATETASPAIRRSKSRCATGDSSTGSGCSSTRPSTSRSGAGCCRSGSA